MGGGSLMTPILILLFGFDPGKAVGTDLVHGAVFKSFGAVRHRRLGTVHAHLALWMFARLRAALACSATGSATQLGKQPVDLQSRVIGWALIVGRDRLPREDVPASGVQSATRRSSSSARDKLIAIALGATGGFVVGMTSVGSGTFFGLVMLLRLSADGGEAGRDGHLPRGHPALGRRRGSVIHGNVVWHAFAWMLVGSIPGVLSGAGCRCSSPTAYCGSVSVSVLDPERDQARRSCSRRTRRTGRSPAASSCSPPGCSPGPPYTRRVCASCVPPSGAEPALEHAP